MFDGQCRDMSVMDEIGPNAGQGKQATEHLRVSVHRLRDPNCLASEPSRYALPRRLRRGRVRKHARVRHHTQEAQQARPR